MNARLLFIGLWNFADDAGRMEDKPKRIKMQVFPGDDLTSEDIHGMLQELSENDLIIRYSVEGKEIIQVKGWDHQRIDKPNKSKLPAHSENDPRQVLESSPPEKEKDSSDSSEKDIGRAKRASPKTRIPQSFPGEAEIAWAVDEEHVPRETAEREAVKFRRDAEAKAKTFALWDRAWKNWITGGLEKGWIGQRPKQSQSEKDDAAFREAARRIGANQ